MRTVTLRDEFIRLGQAMKAAGLVGTGAEAKMEIVEGNVRVNGEVEVRRGRKLVAGDTFTWQGETVRIEA